MAQPRTVPRVNKEEFTLHYAGKDMPAVIINAQPGWSPEQEWTPDFLCRHVGDRPVRVSISKSGRFSYDTDGESTSDGFSEAPMLFSQAAANISKDSDGQQYYIMQYSIPLHFPALMDKVVLPEWVKNRNETSINLWFGRNSITPLHYDAANNFFMQMHGHKHFTLYAPEDSACLYPYPLGTKMPHLSSVDLSDPDYQRFPKLQQVTPYEVNVQAGEILYLPAFWWHQVRAPSISASVSIWWMPELQQYIKSANGTRKLYNQFQSDKLASMEASMLAPNGLNFTSAARMLLQVQQKWACCLLAATACDQYLAHVGRASGITVPHAYSLAEMESILQQVKEQLINVGILQAFSPPLAAVEAIFKMIQKVVDGDEENIGYQEAEQMLKNAELLMQVMQSQSESNNTPATSNLIEI